MKDKFGVCRLLYNAMLNLSKKAFCETRSNFQSQVKFPWLYE